jgi:hypothetical protein
MTLRQKLEEHSGSVYGFGRDHGINASTLYNIVRRKRAASAGVMETLQRTLGEDVKTLFDEDGILLEK